MSKGQRSGCCGFSWLACALLPLILVGVYYGTEHWLATKAYEFSSKEIADVANAARIGYSTSRGPIK